MTSAHATVASMRYPPREERVGVSEGTQTALGVQKDLKLMAPRHIAKHQLPRAVTDAAATARPSSASTGRPGSASRPGSAHFRFRAGHGGAAAPGATRDASSSALSTDILEARMQEARELLKDYQDARAKEAAVDACRTTRKSLHAELANTTANASDRERLSSSFGGPVTPRGGVGPAPAGGPLAAGSVLRSADLPAGAMNAFAAARKQPRNSSMTTSSDAGNRSSLRLSSPSPKTARGRASARGGAHGAGEEREKKPWEMQAEIDSLTAKLADLTTEMMIKQDSYIRREDQMRQEIAAAQETARAALETREAQEHKTTKDLENLYGDVLDSVGKLRERVMTDARLDLSHHESDILKTFRARLYQAEAEANSAKAQAAAMASQGAWPLVEDLRAKVLEYQQVALELDAKFSLAQEEVGRLRQTCHLYELEYEGMTRQMALLKREAITYKLELQKRDAEGGPGGGGGGGGGANAGQANGGGGYGGGSARYDVSPSQSGAWGRPDETDYYGRSTGSGGGVKPAVSPTEGGGMRDYVRSLQHQSELIERLQKQVTMERQQLRVMTEKYLAETASRTELAEFLREAVDAVRSEVSRYSAMHGGAAPGSAAAAAAAGASKAALQVSARAPAKRGNLLTIGVPPALSQEQRDQVLAVLLSKERVLELLIDRTFPGAVPTGAQSGHDPARTINDRPNKRWTGVDTEKTVKEFLKAGKGL